MTALAGSGVLYYADSYTADSLYQNRTEPNERIVVVGIDPYALEEFGTWPWDRAVMGDVLDTLNMDEETRPAVIGVDVIYAGETDPDSDAWLTETASAGNVVLASTVDFTTELLHDADGSSYFSDFEVETANLPFPALAENVAYGHTNAMYDNDGVLRHHLWSVPDGEGGELLSFPYLVYQKFCEYEGVPADFAPPRSERGYWWVDFSGEPGEYYAYSVADILYGEYDPDLLAGSIVLIGPYAAGLADQYLTAADHSINMYGVEYMANVIDAMLRDDGKTAVSDGLQLCILFGLTLLLSLLGVFLKVRTSMILIGGCIAASVAASLVCYQYAGLILHPLWLPIGCAVVLVLTVGIHYLIEALERRRVIKTFERYQDPTIIKELLRYGISDADLQGKTVEIAVLFVDIRGFTPLSERLQPAEVVEILNEYLTLTSTAVKKNGGTLDKFIGDCTMAFWGAPLPCEDKCYRACQAAVYMTERAMELAEKLKERFGHDVSFGVGVHVGPAVVGNIGAPDRKDYTAIGDTVNTASRLEANAPRGTIYISRAVADELGDRAKVTSLGNTIRLKGKTEGFEVLTLDELYPLDENKNKEEPRSTVRHR